MGNHQGSEFVLFNKAVRQFQHFCSSCRIKRSGMLIEQEQFRAFKSCHQKCQCLALATGEQTDLYLQPVLKA